MRLGRRLLLEVYMGISWRSPPNLSELIQILSNQLERTQNPGHLTESGHLLTSLISGDLGGVASDSSLTQSYPYLGSMEPFFCVIRGLQRTNTVFITKAEF